MNAQSRWRIGGLLALAVFVFTQPFGLVAADTKHDLTANPLGFLRRAASAYTEVFTLGQLQ
ncbi:MAG: alpha-(1-_3)-arabinofuranosyltransferase family protein, partial [Corynebacterium striatum]|nr:alpha-(1->3)-arabinofuranosyltransferase family protein [Corynebacterium striatum]